MSATVESVVNQALELSEDERSLVIERLVESLDEPVELSHEMKTTLDRRWEEIVSGKVECRDAFEVLEELRKKYDV